MPSYYTLLWTIPVLLAYKLVSTILTRARHAKAAKSMGAKPGPHFPSPDPLGIMPVRDIYKANEAGQLPKQFFDRFGVVSKQEGYSVHTFWAQFFRLPMINTKDPKNIQALLATQFKDFELGPIRFGTFSPL